MSKSTILLVIMVAVAIHKAAAEAPTTPNYLIEICRTTLGNYTTNSTYEANVKSVLNKLTAVSSNASFANASAGRSASASRVFGQYYCRGDVNASLCNDCIKEAANTIFVNCSNIKSAVIWYEECTLRYDNVSMVGFEAERPAILGWSDANVTDPTSFGPVVNKTLAGLINESAFGENSSFFATGEGVVSPRVTAYCLAQCSPDINGTQCDTCLRSAYDLIPVWWAQFAAVYYPSCQLRYSMQAPFYPLPDAPPPPPESIAPSVTPTTSPSLPPPTTPVTTAPPPSGGSAMLRSRESLNIGVVISAVIFTFLRFA